MSRSAAVWSAVIILRRMRRDQLLVGRDLSNVVARARRFSNTVSML